MNKILFLNPPLSALERYGGLAAAGAMEPPHGLTYLASVMRESGWDVSILDAEALNLTTEDTIASILSSTPDVLACTSVTLSIQRTAEVAAAVKAVRPNVVTLIGGIHLTSQPQETMQRFPSFDYGIIGEGEHTLADLIGALSNGSDVSQVKGIIFREGGEPTRTPPRPYVKDLDALPLPAWDLLPPLASYYRLPPQSILKTPSLSLMTSRGCTGRCIFCDTSVFKNVCRAHSAEYVMEMMRVLHNRFHTREILFEDDNFMLFRKRLEALTEMLLKEPLDLSWSCLARADMITDPSMLRAMRAAGCWQILIGIESGSQEILDFEKKGITLAQIERAVRLSHECGMLTKGFLMVGHPLESKETIRKTIQFVRDIPLDDVSVTFFTVFPGSPFWNDAPKHGALIEEFDKMSVFHPTFIPTGFTAETLNLYARRILKKFYFRPRIMLSYLKRVRNRRQLAAFLKGALALLGHLFHRRIR
jgi:radical SAM superfamily enzyme YgiQ (UPF0313 family)